MSNSKLVTYTKLSPNNSGARTHKIDRITPHCVVGQLTAAGICGCFTSSSVQASCNYAIGKDGDIGLCVDEGSRSWCSSSNANDQRAVTIECASDKTDPYAMTAAVYKSLINLCADICERNGKKKLLWLADKEKTLAYEPADDEMVLSVHRWFAAKSCPGDWLYSRMGDLAAQVTAKLGGKSIDSSKGNFYRVRKSWNDEESQLGAYESLENAKKACIAGYTVYDWNGKAVYTNKETETGAAKNAAEWIEYLHKWEQVMIDAGAIYSNSGNKTSYKDVLKQEPPKTNCALLVVHALQYAGLLDTKFKFYGAADGSIKGNGKTEIRKIATVTDYATNSTRVKDLDLQPGDILTYNGHTNVYLGKDSKGKRQWTDAGRGTSIEGKTGSKWKSFRTTGDMSSYYVTHLIRVNFTGSKTEGLQAKDLKNLSESDTIKKVGALFTSDQEKSGILACVSLAQFILESGYGKTDLAQNANNCFGMKCSLSGNTWSGSTWDGVSKYTKQTGEETSDGTGYTVTADFRKYPNIEDSIADHSAYLNGAKNGNKLRYSGLKGETDYKTAITIIKNGGYATDTKYISKICSIIEKWNLTQYNTASADTLKETPAEIYRIRKTWADASSQIGAYENLELAKKACLSGYSVFNSAGTAVYTNTTAETNTLKVKVSNPYLRIRKEPSLTGMVLGYTGKGIFTIVKKQGDWGYLKSGAGWINLSVSCVEKI